MCQIGKLIETLQIAPREEPIPSVPPRFPGSPRKPVREPVTA